MNETKATILVMGVIGILVILGLGASRTAVSPNLGGNVISAINTWQSGTTNATTTINTTSTQVIASTTKWARITNPTTATITCSLDDRGTTAASSTVATSKGIIIGPQQANASSTGIPALLDVGECSVGDFNCIPFKGTLNCVASAAAVVSVVSK